LLGIIVSKRKTFVSYFFFCPLPIHFIIIFIINKNVRGGKEGGGEIKKKRAKEWAGAPPT
jgi:hypothetical protein